MKKLQVGDLAAIHTLKSRQSTYFTQRFQR